VQPTVRIALGSHLETHSEDLSGDVLVDVKLAPRSS
jgi:hypothetical protein